MAKTQTGKRAIRAIFTDAAAELADQATARSAPDPNLPRPDPDDPKSSIKPGKWPGYPDNAMPPHCPVEVVGRDTGGTVYCVTATGHLRAMARYDDVTLADLFAPLLNDAKWAWPAWGKEKQTDPETGEVKETMIVKRLETKTAAQAIIQEAARKPDFDPAQQHRGRGGWRMSDESFIWHSGRWLWRVEGGKLKRAHPTMTDGFLYTRQTPTIEPWAEPVDATESPAQRILDDLKTWKWARPYLDPVLVLGWLVCAMMGGALKARPIVFTTGGAGVGKSTLHDLIKGVLKGAVFSTVDTTAAGIYQRMKQDCLPVLVDEIEAKAGSSKAQNVIELARAAYTGGDVARGGQDHEGTTFTLRSSFFMSAINPPPLMPQDVSRTAMLNLSALDEHVTRAPKMTLATDTDGRMMLRQIMDGWQQFQNLHQDYWDVLHLEKLDSRAIDTYGTLIAAAHMVVGPDALQACGLPTDDFHQLAAIVASATALERAEQLENWHKCLNHLLQSTIDAWKGGERLTVGGTMEQLRRNELGLQYAQERLYAINLSARDKGKPVAGYSLAVPFDGPMLKRVFADTVWYDGGWSRALKQAPETIVIRSAGNVQKVKINGVTQTCLLVDLDAFDAYLDDKGKAEG